MCVFQAILAYETIGLCKCSGKYIDIYFSLKITFSFRYYFYLHGKVINVFIVTRSLFPCFVLIGVCVNFVAVVGGVSV